MEIPTACSKISTLYIQYNVLNELSKHILGDRIGANFTQPVLRAVVSSATIANFFYGKFANNRA